ncbi:unnamed protein product [Ascophyllum nodosum]
MRFSPVHPKNNSSKALLGDAWLQTHRTGDPILCSTTTDTTFEFRKTSEIPSATSIL